MDFYLGLFLIFVAILGAAAIFLAGSFYNVADYFSYTGYYSQKEATWSKVKYILYAALVLFLVLLCFWAVL